MKTRDVVPELLLTSGSSRYVVTELLSPHNSRNLRKLSSAPAKAPRYVFAAPLGVQPHPAGPAMTKIGKDRWAIQINVTPKMRHYRRWALGVSVDGHVHTVYLNLQN